MFLKNFPKKVKPNKGLKPKHKISLNFDKKIKLKNFSDFQLN